MDVDDDDEFTNAAAAHAAFVITVSGSAARMYWYIMHSTRDINIHKVYPLPEKNRLGHCRFSAQRSTLFTRNRLKTRPERPRLKSVQLLSCTHGMPKFDRRKVALYTGYMFTSHALSA